MRSLPTHHCERCHRDVVGRRPHRGKVVLACGWFVFFFVLTFAAGFSGTLLLGSGVVVFVLGTLVLGPACDAAFQPPRCPACRCVVMPLRVPHTQPDARPSVAFPSS